MIYVGLNQIIRELLRSFEFQPGADYRCINCCQQPTNILSVFDHFLEVGDLRIKNTFFICFKW